MPPTEPPAWLDELDLHVGAPDAAMGTRALDLADWFLVDDDWEPQRREAAAVLDAHRDEVLVGTGDPRVAGPAAELLALVRSLVPAPASVGSGRGSEPPPAGSGRGSGPPPAGSGRGSGPAPAGSGRGSEPASDDALSAARLGVADDLCLLLREGDRWVLAAGCVCFPSHWRPKAKVGRPLTEIHEGVPGYPGPLAGRVDGFLGRLAPGRAVRRRNWLVHDVPDLHLPGPSHRPDPRPEPEGAGPDPRPEPEGAGPDPRPEPGGAGPDPRPEPGGAGPDPRPEPGGGGSAAGRWLRSERQVLVRLAEHDAVVFSIRTQQVRVEVLAGRRDVCAGLASALRGWSPAQRTYKGHAVDDELLRWLDDHAG